MSNSRTTTRTLVVGLAMVTLWGCEHGVPLPKLPQVEQASEVMQGGRARSHQTCNKTSTTVAALIDCMQGFGYDFIARTPGYPANMCWELRDSRSEGHAEARMPPPECFLRKAETAPRGAEPPPR